MSTKTSKLLKLFVFFHLAEQGEKIENRCVLVWEVRNFIATVNNLLVADPITKTACTVMPQCIIVYIYLCKVTVVFNHSCFALIY